MNATPLAIFGMPGGVEWIAIGIVALLIFGKRLPDVARSIGKSIVEFKKGIRDVGDDIENHARIEEKNNNARLDRPSESGDDAPAASKPAKESSTTSQ